MITRFLHLFSLFTLSSCEYNVTEMIEITELRHSRLTDGIGIAISTSSALRCAVNCNSSCISLSYHEDTKSCRIFDFLLSNDNSLTENGWRSYRKNRANCPTDGGYVYNSSLDWCYRLVTELSYDIPEATSFCDLDGAHLIRINSMSRQLHMTEYLLANGVNSIYVGGRSEDKDNNFVYEDGTLLTFTMWDTNQPSNQRSISLNLAGNSYKWRNGHGTYPRPFMCEI
ncbi:macrophage mannose receptor 1-like [Ylistrum balloti]|uniref:macrophage mannose receptor 1-like n=1 Tax=Ylistrum balloti TaxID=509963 RepID=UPI002905C6B6|nr:macrophage mannose receptor 1-like [Ylistrum balloti]